MARKPPDWHQPSLFPADPATSAGQAPDSNTEPPNQSHPETEGDDHAVQDHRFRTPATTTGDVRPASEGPEAANDNGESRQRAEDQPRGLDATARPGEAGQRPSPARLGGAGNSSQGTGGSFVGRVIAERQRGAFPGCGNA